MNAPALRGRQVCITGGGGFVGSHLADALVEHNDVVVVDDFSTGSRDNVPDGARIVEADVRDDGALAEAVEVADVVFHQAAQISVERSIERPVESHEVNVDATISVLERARETDARVVLASSCAIYGDPERVPVPETARPSPNSPYGVEKLAADHYARLYGECYGVETVALRYFNVYGPRQTASDYSGVIGVFLDQAEAGDPITVHGDGTQTRDFVHVSDVVRANLLAATTDDVGRAFNVGTGTETSVRELATAVRRVTGTDSDVVHTDPREADIDRSRADTSRAAEELGFEATVDLAEGLATL